MSDNRYLPTDDLKLHPSCMGGEAVSDRSAIDSNPTSPRATDVAHQGRTGKGVDTPSFFEGEEETDFGPATVGRMLKKPARVVPQTELVDPMSGERSGGGEDSAAQIQELEGKVKRLEGELQHYQLRVAGVTALVDMLNEKKEEAVQWRVKSEKLETALSRMEHKAGKLERELRERNAGEDSGRRMAPVLPPNKQILNKLARENAQLKLALNRLMGKGIYGYQEGLHISDLERVIEEQAQSIRLLQTQLQKLREGCGITQTQPSDKLPDSGLGASMSLNSTSAPASLSGTSGELASLKNEMLSLEEKLLRRERFIVTLAEKLAEYQAKDREMVTTVGPRSLPVLISRDVQMPQEESKVHIPQQQESTDSNIDAYEVKIKELEEKLSDRTLEVEKLSAQYSATCGELETSIRKCKLAEDEAESIRQRAQIHFGKDMDVYTTEINHLRTMVGRLSRQAQDLQKQLEERDEELRQFRSDSAVSAKDDTIVQLKEENSRLQHEMEEADFELKRLKSDQDSVDELREQVDDLGSEVRKLRSDKRSLDSQFNEVKANYKAALAENNQFRAFLRQAGVYNPTQRPSDVGLIRPPMEAYRGTAIAVVDNPRAMTGGFRESAVQSPHPVTTIQARSVNPQPDPNAHAHPSSTGHLRPLTPQTRPSFVTQGQPQMVVQDYRSAMAREVSGGRGDGVYSHSSNPRDNLTLALGPAQYGPPVMRPSNTSEGVLPTTTTMSFSRTGPHFVQDPTGPIRQMAGSPNATRYVAEREHSGSGASYSAMSRNPHHRQ